MVAAWISAETGVGPSIASGSQVCSGNCPDLPQAPSSSISAIAVITPAGQAADPGEDLLEVGGAEVGEHQHDRDRQADVTDPVGDEGLLGGGAGRLAGVVVADQQVGGQAHAFPADVEHQVAVGQHQQQHGGHEQVEVAEEPPAAGIVVHVADRVDVDQRADPGDQQDEGQRQRVEQEADVDLEAAHRHPAEQVQVALALPSPRLVLDREEQQHAVDEQHRPGRARRAGGPTGRHACRAAAAAAADSAGSATSSQAEDWIP